MPAPMVALPAEWSAGGWGTAFERRCVLPDRGRACRLLRYRWSSRCAGVRGGRLGTQSRSGAFPRFLSVRPGLE